MDWAVFDRDGKVLAGPYEEEADGEIRAELTARRQPTESGAWAAPVCDWHPTMARENCPGYPHDS